MSKNADTISQVITWYSYNWWWVTWPVFGVIGSFVEGLRDFILEALETIFGRNHGKVLEEQAAEPLPVPGPCVHRNVIAIVSDDRTVGWLCKTCEIQLPADWAIRKEDL